MSTMLKVLVTIFISLPVTGSLCERWCLRSSGRLCRLICPDMSQYLPIRVVPTILTVNTTRWECIKDYDELYTTHQDTIEHLGDIIAEKNNIYIRMVELQQHRDGILHGYNTLDDIHSTLVHNVSRYVENQQKCEIENRALLTRQLHLEYLMMYAYCSDMVVPTEIIPDSTAYTMTSSAIRRPLNCVFLLVHIFLVFKLHAKDVHRSALHAI